MSKKVIISIAHLIPGGAERFSVELANEASRQGFETYLLLQFKKIHFFNVDNNVKIIEPEFEYNSKNKISYYFKLRKYVRSNVRKVNPDSILIIGSVSLMLSYLFDLKFKLFISNRSNPVKPRPFWYKVVRFILYSKSNGMIAQTKTAAEHYSKVTRNRNINIIPNFVRSLNNVSIDINKKQNIIVTVGRFISTKNHVSLLRIFAKTSNIDWKLVLVGDGPKRAEIEQISKDLGIEDKIYLTGFTKDVDYWLSISKIFAFTSLSEGYPNALLEAMAAELPCIAYDCNAGPSDLIRNGENGFLIPENDEEQFIMKLNMLMQDNILRNTLSKNAISVREEHSVSVITKRYLDFILA